MSDLGEPGLPALSHAAEAAKIGQGNHQFHHLKITATQNVIKTGRK